jgi:hypothetical protein
MSELAFTQAEFAALMQLGKSFSRGTILPAIRNRLMKLGYAREVLGSLLITNAGTARLADLRT